MACYWGGRPECMLLLCLYLLLPLLLPPVTAAVAPVVAPVVAAASAAPAAAAPAAAAPAAPHSSCLFTASFFSLHFLHLFDPPLLRYDIVNLTALWHWLQVNISIIAEGNVLLAAWFESTPLRLSKSLSQSSFFAIKSRPKIKVMQK